MKWKHLLWFVIVVPVGVAILWAERVIRTADDILWEWPEDNEFYA